MKTKVFTFVILLLLLPALNLKAAIMIEVDNEDGKSRIYSDGLKGRIEMGGNTGFVIVDTEINSLFLIMPEKQIALDMSSSLKANSDTEVLDQVNNKAELQKVGKGPRIEGYKTVKFEYLTNGSPCGTVFLSKKALKDLEMKQMFDIFRKMGKRAKELTQKMNVDIDPCETAYMGLSDEIAGKGIPLRTEYQDGTLKNLVTKIEKNAKLPPDSFTIPENYRIVKPGQMMQVMQERIEQNRPQLEEMIEQLKKSGRLSPDALERLREARESLK